MDQVLKKPADRLDYDIDFTRWLTDGDSVVAMTATISAGGVEIDETMFADQTVKVWLAGGAAGDQQTVTVIVTTAEGREKQFCFRIRVTGC